MPRELLADGRGILVPRADTAAIAREVNDLLGDDVKRRSLGERAAAYGVSPLWPSVADAYLESFERACAEHKQQDRTRYRAQTLLARVAELPDVHSSPRATSAAERPSAISLCVPIIGPH